MKKVIHIIGCTECIFYQFVDNDSGECRRHAPRPSQDGIFVWPRVVKDIDWCGDAEEDPDKA